MYAVIGAAGQVGQEFAKVVGSERLHLLTHAQVDVADPDSIERGLEGTDCSAIVNLAAFHDVNGCEADPERAFRVNALGAANVAQVAKRRRCRAVFFSSDYVFGQDEGRRSPYLEGDRPAPLNVYGTSKAAGEDRVQSTLADHLIVRTSSLFGVTTSRKGWTFPEMIVRRAQAGEPLRVVNDQYAAPTYTLDLVHSVVSLLEAGATGIVHVTNGGGCSWHELALATLEMAGIEHPVEAVSSSVFASAARRPAYSRLGSDRLASWGVEPLRDWRLALQAYLTEKGITR
jgi:dTDP-4-dehydrorhamnose reductase